MVSEGQNVPSAGGASEGVVRRFFRNIPKPLKWLATIAIGGAILGPLFF